MNANETILKVESFLENLKKITGLSIEEYAKKCSLNDYVQKNIQGNLKEEIRELESQIKNHQSRIEEIMESDEPTKYQVESLIFSLENLKQKQREFLNLQAKQLNIDNIEEIFSKFSPQNKTSDELQVERNERLAIANKLFVNGNIEQPKFVSLVVSIRRCYKEAIEKQVAKELDNSKHDEGLLTKVFSKVKRVFGMGKQEEREKGEDERKKIINTNAFNSLIKVEDILRENPNEKNEIEARDLLGDAMEIFKEIPHERISEELENVRKSYLTDSIETLEKTRHSTVIGDDKVDLTDIKKDWTRKEILNIFEPSPSEDHIKGEQLKFENFMLKKYPHKKAFTGNLNEITMTITFEDDGVQKAYEEMQEIFKKNIENASKYKEAEQDLLNETQKISEKYQEMNI